MEWLKNSYPTIIVVIILLVLCVYSLISIRKSKGKCAYCSHSATCPFKARKK